MPDSEVMRLCVIPYLKHAASLRDTLEELKEDLARLESMADVSAQRYRATPWNHLVNLDATFDAVNAIEEAKQKLLQAQAEYLEDYLRAREICRPCFVARWACWLHWAECKTWEEVARRVNYSESWTRQYLAPTGIEEIYYAMPEEARRDAIPNAAPFDEWGDL